MNIQKAIAAVQKQRDTNIAPPLSAWGLKCNLAFQAADRILDKQENISYEDDLQANGFDDNGNLIRYGWG